MAKRSVCLEPEDWAVVDLCLKHFEAAAAHVATSRAWDDGQRVVAKISLGRINRIRQAIQQAIPEGTDP